MFNWYLYFRPSPLGDADIELEEEEEYIQCNCDSSNISDPDPLTLNFCTVRSGFRIKDYPEYFQNLRHFCYCDREIIYQVKEKNRNPNY